ncbi:Abhydrolase domain-containing protein 16A [Fasciola gigantica]|uniref:Abhydrolase domain-containing protein 16A n=1 Tax=Fasciola gigantica TaxID=46835 RepID=A0A504YII3_FASGI|nr:Abhydrolase domain-containing protein 16A [Fasciola gigantica]
MASPRRLSPLIQDSLAVTSPDYLYSYIRFGGYVALFYMMALALRGTGRLCNDSYSRFAKLFLSATEQRNDLLLEKLTLYSFSSPWPAQFDVRTLSAVTNKVRIPTPKRDHELSAFLWPITWLVAHTLGVRVAYPGCTGILNSLSLPQRLDGRDRLRRHYGIRRVGLLTRDADFVEAFFADRRGSTSSAADITLSGHGDSKGEIMIICCEGNGGYPEIGTPLVPLEQGYSVMAWNHPGFGASTNLPFPEKEQNAVEAALLFVMHQLHFKPHQIYLFGWSIGGYTVTWAAMNYPEIAGVILDATFDDLDELSKKVVPDFLYPITRVAMRQHMDLNNLAQLVKYDGPVRIIRRADDEIISTSEPPSREANRGTNLLVGLLRHRFPHLMTDENEMMLLQYLSLSASEQS